MLSPIPRPPPVTSALSGASANRPTDRLERLGILERRQVARILAERAGPHRAADDLGGARLRQRADPDDPLRLERLAEGAGDRVCDRFVPLLLARLHDAEDPRDLAFHGVRYADRRRLVDDAAPDRGRLELGRPDALACDVQRVVRAAVQEPVAVGVDGGPVAVRPDAGEAAPVRLQVALVVTPDAPRHSGPRSPADELADLLAHG